MNELLNNFINQIDDVNKIREMSVEEFTKLVKSNQLISDDDAKLLIESFKKISTKKNSEDESSDADQRKKKYREQHKQGKTEAVYPKDKKLVEKEKDDNSIER